MKQVVVFLGLVVALMLVEASQVRHPRASTAVPKSLQPVAVTVTPLQG